MVIVGKMVKVYLFNEDIIEKEREDSLWSFIEGGGGKLFGFRGFMVFSGYFLI